MDRDYSKMGKDDLIVRLTYEHDPFENNEHHEKSDFLRNTNPGYFVKKHVNHNLKNLYIVIPSKCEGFAYYLYCNHQLKDCYNSTLAAIPFFDDDDKLYKGKILSDSYKNKSHAWICFNYKNETYVFDPELSLIIPYKEYQNAYNPDVMVTHTSKEIRNELINIFRSNVPDKYDFYNISGSDDIDDPFFNCNMEINSTYNDKKIKRLCVKYR